MLVLETLFVFYFYDIMKQLCVIDFACGKISSQHAAAWEPII